MNKSEAWRFLSWSLMVPLSRTRTVDANQNHPAQRKQIFKWAKLTKRGDEMLKMVTN